MNILPCLALCVAFASCVLNESAGTAVDTCLDAYHNDTLHKHLFEYKDFSQALYRFYEALEDFVTRLIVLDLNTLMEGAAKGPSGGIIFGGLSGLMWLTGHEYQCYCNFYVEKIRWIKEALQQGSYSAENIMKNIVLLSGYAHSHAVHGAKWHEDTKESLEKHATKIPLELETPLAKALGKLEKLRQAQWAVVSTCLLKYGEHSELLKMGVVGDHYNYAVAFCGFIKSYTNKKLELMGKMTYFTKALGKEFLDEFTKCVVAPDDEFQKSLEKIDPGTPLKFPEDSNGKEKGAILLMILKGTAKKFEGTAAKESASAIGGAESGAKKDSAGKTFQEPLLVECKTKNESKLAIDQSELHGIGTGEMGAKIDVEGKVGKKTSKQRPQQETKTKTKLQVKKDAEKEAEKEKKEMVKYTGGISDKRIRRMEKFVVLHGMFDSKPREMTYEDVQELFTSQVWLDLGIDKGNALLIHPPHGRANMNDLMCNTIFGLCQDKWESFKSQDNYAIVLGAIKKHKEEAEKKNQEK